MVCGTKGAFNFVTALAVTDRPAHGGLGCHKMQVTSPQVIPGDPLIFTTNGGCPCKQPYAKNFGMLF